MTDTSGMTDADCAALCNAIYSDPRSVDWVHFEDGSSYGVCWGAVRRGGVIVVVNRGSLTVPDWVRDAEALADPLVHSGLGPVHPGFFAGMDRQFDEVEKLGPSDPKKFVGHSLGAGHGALQTGMHVLAGRATVLPRFAIGEPCSTFQQGADVVARAGGASYRNGDGAVHDPVTSVPVRFWPELYVHALRMTDVTARPSLWRRLRMGPFAWHHGPLYQSAIAALKK